MRRLLSLTRSGVPTAGVVHRLQLKLSSPPPCTFFCGRRVSITTATFSDRHAAPKVPGADRLTQPSSEHLRLWVDHAMVCPPTTDMHMHMHGAVMCMCSIHAGLTALMCVDTGVDFIVLCGALLHMTRMLRDGVVRRELRRVRMQRNNARAPAPPALYRQGPARRLTLYLSCS